MAENKVRSFNWRLFWFQFFTAVTIISFIAYMSMMFLPVFYEYSAISYFFPFNTNSFLPVFVMSFYIYCLLVSFRMFFAKQNQERGLVLASVPFVLNVAAYFLSLGF